MKNSYIYANGQTRRGVAQRSQILCRYEHDSPPADRYFYIHDRLGSVRLVVNDAADVNNSYTYGPFGEPFTSECSETVYNPFLLTGQWYDSEIQQYYLRARQYSPYLGRFTGRDPILGDFTEPLTLHKYLYCVNDPVNNRDITGRAFWPIFGALSAGIAVHSAAIFVTGKGVYGNPALMDIGMAMEHLVAPAMLLGALLGPGLPDGGELAIKAGAGAWNALAGGGIDGWPYHFCAGTGILALCNNTSLGNRKKCGRCNGCFLRVSFATYYSGRCGSSFA